MTGLKSLLRPAELDAEKTAALVRVAILLSLAVAILSAVDADHVPTGPAVALAAYGLGTVVGLVLAWRRIFHPSIPYLLVTFDVVLVAVQVLMLSRMMGMPPAGAFSLPATGLIFVILAYAALRYRPWLVVYAGALFVAAIEFGSRLPAADAEMAMTGHMGQMSTMAHNGMARVLNYQALPPTLVAVATFILFVMGRRTRSLLLASVQQAARTARLSRYFSPNLAARLAEGDEDQLLAGRRQPVAVLFVDIRGFTTLGETMAPDELGAFLSEYRRRLARPVFAHGGTVDKFIGDAIMAVFGSPLQRADDAERAVRCALEILQAAREWSSERERAGKAPVAIGIGGHYGEVFAGALGGEQLLEFTVIGDTVNVAERLERLSREVSSPLVVSAALLEAAGNDAEGAGWRRLPLHELKGHRQPVEALCLASFEWGDLEEIKASGGEGDGRQ
ncbi:adenylate cyclase [Tistlia consotensis]|uniref:Adenylate cyclase n=1 Tax=Tistlia consotensis USBA 355 TaxID=560819 RepID=A0A1Y6BZ27_9PROT|nr:adenylate/guanylate cyclase domain-containing protein [Tistlia consotensis]SMF27457.1 adenylate cyclase [Tistlia consotensis USBA 355]SNR66063.1 adenylate cyclase [Tistlia consotensis]